MKIYRTELSKTSLVSTQLEFLHVAHQRNLLRTQKDRSLYRNLRIGDQGEQFVVEALEKYGCQHWVVLRNVWLEWFGVYENDIVLITGHAIYVLEVKNYAGKFEYKNSRCYMNGRKLKENCIQQAEKAWMNLREICGAIDRSIPVKGALLFVGEHNEVAIQSDVDGVQVVTRPSLREFIQSIRRAEEANPYPLFKVQGILTHFEKKEVLNPFGPKKAYTAGEVLSGKLGMHCQTCGSYEVEVTKMFIRCENSHQELRNEAVFRMIEEFRVLAFETEYVTRAELMQFLDYQVSEPYLIKFLNRYFIRVHNGRYSKYQINRRLD